MTSNLEEAFRNNDLKALNETAHKLKPNIQMMGIKSIIESIRNLEYYKSDKFDDTVYSDIVQVISSLSSVVEDFKLLVVKK
jgi:HPt (histidine-containing phosphotransfer) domain-containing protein